MINKILYLLYINSFFRCCISVIKISSLFNKDYNKKLSYYRFFKKRKKWKKKILKIIYQPKIFIINFPYDTQKIIKKIYNYDLLYQKNEYSFHGHKNIYQSNHNLNKNKDFKLISNNIEKFVNKNILKFLSNNKLRLVRIWFVITKNFGFMRRHSHFNADFSGVLYLKVDRSKSSNSAIKVFNNLKNIEIYEYSKQKNLFIKRISRKKIFIFRPKKNDLILFNSYVEHSVVNKNSKISDRISLPFDMMF